MRYLKDGWLILVLGLVFAAGLTAVHLKLSPIIEKNQKDKIYRRIPLLTLGAVSLEGLSVQPAAPIVELIQDGRRVETLRVDEVTHGSLTAYRVSRGDTLVGYVLRGEGPGYADRITLLVGLSADLRTIRGISVIQQVETPNLGTKIVGVWADQFEGKAAWPPLEVTKGGSPAPGNNEIDAISGATISSKSVTDIVNKAVAAFLAEREGLQWPAAPSDTTTSGDKEI